MWSTSVWESVTKPGTTCCVVPPPKRPLWCSDTTVLLTKRREADLCLENKRTKDHPKPLLTCPTCTSTVLHWRLATARGFLCKVLVPMVDEQKQHCVGRFSNTDPVSNPLENAKWGNSRARSWKKRPDKMHRKVPVIGTAELLAQFHLKYLLGIQGTLYRWRQGSVVLSQRCRTS